MRTYYYTNLILDYLDNKLDNETLNVIPSIKLLKYYYLYKVNITSFEKLCEVVAFAVSDFNNRPHRVLSGASPNEVFSSNVVKPDLEILATLRQNRIAENKMKCCRI